MIMDRHRRLAGEFVGTIMFLFFAFTGAAVSEIPAVDGSSDLDISSQTYIALCFGFFLTVNVWVFCRVSGGLRVTSTLLQVSANSASARQPPIAPILGPGEVKLWTLPGFWLEGTLALVLIRAISAVRGIFVLIAQLHVLSGIAAAGLSTLLLPTLLNVSTSLADEVSLALDVFVEALLKFELVFTIFMLGYQEASCYVRGTGGHRTWHSLSPS